MYEFGIILPPHTGTGVGFCLSNAWAYQSLLQSKRFDSTLFYLVTITSHRSRCDTHPIMKKLFSITFVLCVLAIVGCSDDGGGGGGETGGITVPPAQQQNLTQDITAYETSGSGVTFNTAGAWTSRINTTRSSGTDWVSISPDHGDKAGTYTIAISLTPNETGEERRAEIIITCGDTNIVINISQSATDVPDDNTSEDEEDNHSQGEESETDWTPQFGAFAGPRIKSMEHYFQNCDDPDNPVYELQSTRTFVYNNNNLLAEVTQRWGDGEYDYEKYSFTYPEGNSKTMTMKCDAWNNLEGSVPSVVSSRSTGYEYNGYESVMTLNQKGYIVSAITDGETTTLEYGVKDNLTRVNYPDCGHTEYVWEDLTVVYCKYDEMDDGQYVREENYRPLSQHTNPFFKSQVDPLAFCQEELGTFEPWAMGLAGIHNHTLYELVSSSDVEIRFHYEWGNKEYQVDGITVKPITCVTVVYEWSSGDTMQERYILEYYE